MSDKKLIYEYYPIYFQYKALSGYLLWFTETVEGWNDGLVTKDGKVVYFNSLESLNNYATEAGFTEKIFTSEEVANYNMQPINEIINKGLKSHKDYKIMLDTWNLLRDICFSLYGKENSYKIEVKISEKYSNSRKVRRKYIEKVYNKIFWANNLTVVTPPGRHYVPIWRKSELRLINRIFREGMNIFENNILNIIIWVILR